MSKSKYAFFILFAALSIGLPSCHSKSDLHLGEWSGAKYGDDGSFILAAENNATLIFGNQVMGGKPFDFKGATHVLKYEIDYSKDPIWLDFVVKEMSTGREQMRIKSIMRFLTDDKIEWRVNLQNPNERYTQFDPQFGVNTIILERVVKK